MGRAERERVRRRVTGGATAIDALVTAVHEQVPAYRAHDGSRLPEIRAVAGWVLGRSLDLWVKGAGSARPTHRLPGDRRRPRR